MASWYPIQILICRQEYTDLLQEAAWHMLVVVSAITADIETSVSVSVVDLTCTAEQRSLVPTNTVVLTR